jgi:hypothetical protein
MDCLHCATKALADHVLVKQLELSSPTEYTGVGHMDQGKNQSAAASSLFRKPASAGTADQGRAFLQRGVPAGG